MIILKDLLDQDTIHRLNEMSLSLRCGTDSCGDCECGENTYCHSSECMAKKDRDDYLMRTLDKHLEWRRTVLFKKF